MKKQSQGGFTLLEMVLVTTILGFVASGTVYLLSGSVVSVLEARQYGNLAGYAQLAMNRMSMDFRDLQSVTTATATQFTFTISNSSTMDYQMVAGNGSVVLNGEDLVRSLGPTHTANNTGPFTYRKADGTAWTTADPDSELMQVTATLFLVPPNAISNANDQVRFSITVSPRNNGAASVPF